MKAPDKKVSRSGSQREGTTVQRAFNQETAGAWESFEPHRRHMTTLIAGSGGGHGRSLALLGAGNCNDVSLPELVACFGRVHLLDLDRAAIHGARGRQSPEVAERLVLHGSVDLGGALAEVGAFRARSATRDELGALSGSASRRALEGVPDRFDVVASTCLLSQLVHGCRLALGDAHPQLQPIACAVVVAHLRVVAQLLRAGGIGLIVTDLVSSDTYPLEELWDEQAPWALVEELEATGNHLSGTAPTFLRRIINTDPVIAPLVGAPRLERPWLWRVGPEETYLVYALSFQRRN